MGPQPRHLITYYCMCKNKAKMRRGLGDACPHTIHAIYALLLVAHMRATSAFSCSSVLTPFTIRM